MLEHEHVSGLHAILRTVFRSEPPVKLQMANTARAVRRAVVTLPVSSSRAVKRLKNFGFFGSFLAEFRKVENNRIKAPNGPAVATGRQRNDYDASFLTQGSNALSILLLPQRSTYRLQHTHAIAHSYTRDPTK